MIFTHLSIVVVLLAGALAVPAPGTGALVGYCNTSVDCKANECCVSFNRDSVVDLTPDLKRLVRGKCEPLGGQGAVCYVSIGPNPPGLPDRYYYACPCIKGAFCSKNAPSLPRVGGPGKCIVVG
ncbi:uncharacterized protein LOC127854859 [Dreissena polymorpha]|uniref:Prokineticin domain-containing protein n=1 Tax=Dreissena polymorpha TaxID=45954 RepID=A0A9D4C7Y2_DREPO|nr:uncharacterized protein LOC127854859 [Dreissena polymorpha]KAH3718764.1 hypothetical protein DPMN_061571 [Dreissena polymorpha]